MFFHSGFEWVHKHQTKSGQTGESKAKKALRKEGCKSIICYALVYMTRFTASITSWALGNHSSNKTGE